MPRIVSLLPSLTEIVHALGCGDDLVGRSHECDHPKGVERLPACTAPRFDPEGSSREVDGRVRGLVRAGLSVYDVDVERLRELAPDVVLTQDQCDVCAASLADVEAALGEITGHGARVVSVAPASLADVWQSALEVAGALGVPDRGAELVAGLTDRITGVGEAAGAARDGGPRPRVACLEWLDPLMGAGNWVPELVALAGGEPLFGEPGAHSDWIAWEDLRAADPDVLVLLPCGFDRGRTRAELPRLTERPGWSDLAAVRAGRVFLTDGSQYFNRPGPRLVESLEILAEIVHPGDLAFGHAGSGYERLS